MRVIAGTLGGRIFDSPGNNRTHPMSDKARGALFNALGDIEGLRILDAFAGTGALGFEAVSRGAAHVVALESDKAAQQTITRNIAKLDISKYVRLIGTSANAWLQAAAPTTFDVILCDPPYDDLQLALIERLAVRVANGGVLVLSWPGAEPAPALDQFKQVAQRGYGDMQLIFYRKPAA